METRKYLLSLAVMISFGFYVIWVKNNSINSVILSKTISNLPTNTENLSQNMPAGMGKNMMGMMNRYKDGEFIGDIVDAYYGNVQVKIVIANGKITDVLFLDYPHNARNSIRINSYAMPILKQEVIQAQSAKVNGVSGASSTSPAFIKSLTSALEKAKV